MAWRTANRIGCGGGPSTLFSVPPELSGCFAGSDPVPEDAFSEKERNLAKSKLTGVGGFE